MPDRKRRLEARLGHRPREEKTLVLIAIRLAEPGELISILDALRHDGKAEPMRQIYDRSGDGRGSAIAGQWLDEGLGKLDAVDGEISQRRKGGVAGSKIVDGNLASEGLELGQLLYRVRPVFHDPAFRNLEVESRGREAGSG